MKFSFVFVLSFFLSFSLFSATSNKSCPNVINGLARLNEGCIFYGSINYEKDSWCFLKCLEESDLDPRGSALTMCLIQPDDCTSAPKDVNPDIFKNVKLLHIHAEQLGNLSFLKKCLELAKNQNTKISLDLADIKYVKKYKNEILNLIPRYIDILFANEREILELTHLPPLQACDYLATLTEVVVVTMGYFGSWVKSGKRKFYTPSLKTNQIDNAGVGDYFISGFLYGYLNEAFLSECSWLGSFVASKALDKNKRVSRSFWSQILSSIHEGCEEISREKQSLK